MSIDMDIERIRMGLNNFYAEHWTFPVVDEPTTEAEFCTTVSKQAELERRGLPTTETLLTWRNVDLWLRLGWVPGAQAGTTLATVVRQLETELAN